MKNQGLSKIRSRMKSHMVPILILLTGIILISILYWEARKDALEQLRKQFLMDAATRASIIHVALKEHLIDLEGLYSFYNASTSVTRKAFAAFVAPTLKTRSGIQAFEWIPRVAYAERARFEAEARRDGLQDYQIYQLDSKGNKVAAGPHQYYYPVYYVEPLAGNEPAVGFDLASNPARLAALEQATDTGQPVATQRITLVQETGSQAGFLIFIPVYRQEIPLTTAEQRRVALQGFVLGVFRAGDAVEAAIRPSPEKGLLTELVDLHEVADKQLLYHFQRKQLPLKAGTWETLLAPSVTLDYEYPFTYASRQWRVDITASPAYVQGHISLSHWLIPPIGVLLTLSLALYFEGLLSHKERAENLVAVRTAELVQANEMMQAEITERKRAEESIKESLRLRQQILDTIPSPIFYKGIDSRYKGVNQAFLQFHGKTMEQVLGKTVHEVFPKEIAEKYLRMDQDLFQHPGIQVYGFHNYDAHGQRREMSVHKATFLDKDGSIAGLAGIMIDITEQKKVEEERLRFSKLESMSTLAGGIAHDFNNILTVILGNIGLAMLYGKIEPQVRDRLAQAEQACLRAQALSQQLLTFAKGGAPIKKIISISKLLKEAVGLTLSGSKSRCEFSIPDDLWSVEADEAQINQVISNLLINADQAMPEGGIIKIKAENCLVAAESNLPISKGKYVKFAIADQGIGISPKYLDKIFDPYFSTKQKGSGLGLATAYSIIKNHSGHIQVESQLGVGATFHIYLPAYDKGVPADEREALKPTMGQGKVLVMDDEEMVREVLGGMLSRLGYEADFANDGSQAIEKFVKAKETHQPFAAVILDLTIPGGMGGKEAIQGLLKIDPQVKAIVSSGYSDDPIMADFQKYGVSEVIAKPYRVAELSKILQRVIPGKRAN